MSRAATAVLALLAAGGVAKAETLICTPKYPTFCRNTHVGCAGRTTAPTRPFAAELEAGRVRFSNGEVIAVTAARSHSGVVLRPEAGDWWIRIDPGLRFSRRIVWKGAAAMSVGRCVRE